MYKKVNKLNDKFIKSIIKFIYIQIQREGYFDNNLLIQFPNNLEGNFKKNKPITIKMSGISDNYILWVLEDLKPVSSYHIELPKNKSAVLSYKPGNKTKNVKAIAIPLSSNLPEESTSLVVK